MGRFPGQLAFKHSPQIFYSVEVGALGRPFQQLYVRLFYQFQNKFCCFLGIIDLLEHSLVSRFTTHDHDINVHDE